MENADTTDFACESDVRKRGFAGLRVVLFVLLAIALGTGAGTLLKSVGGVLTDLPGSMAIGELVMFAVVMAATAIMALFSGRRFLSYGLGGGKRIRDFLVGAGAGGVLLAGELTILWAMGNLSFGTIQAGLVPLLQSALLYAVMFLGVALFEETSFRGYMLVELSRAVSFWPAALLIAAAFGAIHMANGGESLPGVISAGLFGLVLAITFRLTGSLWMAIGLHFGWNYAQSFVFGTSNSGTQFDGTLLHASTNGPDWLTGGSVGPEGSVLVLIPLALIPLIGWLLRRQPKTDDAS